MGNRYSRREQMPVRLGPPPKAKSLNVTKSMKGNKAKNTGPELALRKALWGQGIRGYRLNWHKIPGRPDICLPLKKLAIFVNGCFWHRCPYCRLTLPKSNRVFWKRKFRRNKERDRLKRLRLKQYGWKTLTIWECQIKKNKDKTLHRISKSLKR